MPSEENSPTVRAGVYARYSSGSQRDASIDDQARICRAEIGRKGRISSQSTPTAVLEGVHQRIHPLPRRPPHRAPDCLPAAKQEPD